MIDLVNTTPAALLEHLERAIAQGFAAPRGATVAMAWSNQVADISDPRG